jgi:hypothetical protein
MGTRARSKLRPVYIHASSAKYNLHLQYFCLNHMAEVSSSTWLRQIQYYIKQCNKVHYSTNKTTNISTLQKIVKRQLK